MICIFFVNVPELTSFLLTSTYSHTFGLYFILCRDTAVFEMSLKSQSNFTTSFTIKWIKLNFGRSRGLVVFASDYGVEGCAVKFSRQLWLFSMWGWNSEHCKFSNSELRWAQDQRGGHEKGFFNSIWLGVHNLFC